MPYPVPQINRDECIHCGACAQLCPRVFTVSRHLGHALVIDPGGASPLTIQEAMDTCPVQCIHWLAPAASLP